MNMTRCNKHQTTLIQGICLNCDSEKQKTKKKEMA